MHRRAKKTLGSRASMQNSTDAPELDTSTPRYHISSSPGARSDTQPQNDLPQSKRPAQKRSCDSPATPNRNDALAQDGDTSLRPATPTPRTPKRVRFSPHVSVSRFKREDSLVQQESDPALYYDIITDVRKKVKVGDFVARYRSGEEMEIGGMQGRFDILDGPWKIIQIGEGEDAEDAEVYKVIISEIDELSDDERRVHWDQMLETRIQLDFPPASHRDDNFVSLKDLLPCVKPETVTFGTVFTSSLNIEELKFNNIKARIERCANIPTDENDSIYLAEIEEDKYIAILRAEPNSVDEDDELYVVERIRDKRLRFLELKNKGMVKSDLSDPWILRLQRQYPEILQKKVVVAQYLVHWAGWPEEDDCWADGGSDFPSSFVTEYNRSIDPYKDVPEDRVVYPRAIIKKRDWSSYLRSNTMPIPTRKPTFTPAFTRTPVKTRDNLSTTSAAPTADEASKAPKTTASKPISPLREPQEDIEKSQNARLEQTAVSDPEPRAPVQSRGPRRRRRPDWSNFSHEIEDELPGKNSDQSEDEAMEDASIEEY